MPEADTARPKAANVDREPDHPTMRAQQLLLDIDDVCEILALSRTTVYKLIMAGDIESVIIGTKQRRVTYAAVERYVAALPQAPASR
jgi:excisionase family DNA binding protein